jgi:hypothetical protein
MVNSTDLYADILALNQTAAAASQYEVAYHLLAAALHAADVSDDPARIETVLRLAAEQGAAVNSRVEHPLAAVNAAARGNTPIYESLAATARARLAQINAERLIARTEVLRNQDALEDKS